MIAGLEEITAGSIRINNQVINDIEPKNRDIAMVFQNYALYPHMTIRENMGFSLRLAKRSKAEREQSVREAAVILGLEDYLDRFPRQLSGGQRQRVAMGRAIVRNPSVFLFDEPLSNLDAKLRVQMRAELKSLHRRLNTTTVYVTHDQVEAMTMADKIVVMRDGIVEQAGAPLDVFDQPVNRFVASFIGSPAMNFIHGSIIDSGGQISFQTNAGQLLPVDDQVARAHVGRPVVYGVRPEHLFISNAAGAFSTRIDVVEPTGSETHIVTSLGKEQLVALVRERIHANPDSTLSLQVQTGQSHLFDSASGARLH
jgi:multiple sugar transport system ATP-binding protein